MPSKSIHQLTFSSTREDDDRLYVVRNGVDYQIPMSALAPALLSQTTVIPAADVLTLNSDPVQVVDAAPTGYAAFPVRAVVQFSGGSADYATNTTLVIGSTSTLSDTSFNLQGDISDRSQAFAMAQYNVSVVTARLVDGDSLSAYVTTGNPTAGNSILTVTTYYYLLPL